MNRTWLRKTIWSYLPIFCIIFSLLFFVFFQTLVEQNNRNTKDSSEVFLNQLLQSLDVGLRSIDNTLIREMSSGKLLNDFFLAGGEDDVFLNYQVVNRMLQLKQAMPMIDSYYLVRYRDGIVFSGVTTKLDKFSDYDFIHSRMSGHPTYTSSWSAFRPFREFPNQRPKGVVSLVRNVSLSSGMDGMIVVNVSLPEIRSMLGETFDAKRAFVQVYDRAGRPLFDPGGAPAGGKVLAAQTSSYTGWKAETGVANGMAVAVMSSLSSVWLMLGLLVFLAGGLSIVYIARKNYKPIADLVYRIQDQFGTGKPSLGRLAVDEFTFIETAIDNFAEQSKRFRKEAEETAARRRKSLFRELLQAEHGPPEELEPLALPPHDRIQAFVVEIDEPELAFGRYSGRDRSLFQYVVGSAAHELFASRHPVQLWLEWTSPVRMTGILFLEAAAGEIARETAPHITSWVREHLAFTVTIGIGGAADAGAGAGPSHRQALEALTFKAVLGHDRVIVHGETARAAVKETNKHLQAIHKLSQQLRLREEEWRTRFEDFFRGMRECCLPRGDIAELCRYFLALMDLQLSEASKEYYELWQHEAAGPLLQAVDEFDTLDRLRERFGAVLGEFAARLDRLSGHRQHRQLLQDIRDYIAEHYANPELSLDHLGERFGLGAKYVSQLFKEEFGENFLDYLSQLRIMEAKKRLLEQPDSIQEVGERVGYANAATFRRVFRKVEGISPVDFRKRNAAI
ncbi:helix-turn-helix domain-containing protein [Paenibacillus sp. MWE-103]|uniref:Helix-turn-helix domain-containing protein n=1 Tax=Paenibacillus artemisiicola TaxID=1172618 RepID=A0ABS3WC52_9BACL|nr:helix-turn-helix domain-containing protein [Paenibacillus artemisiicola]MBO7745909.1 helix-turn-helix domain-containing protein [Paenibacillus artemisiicola]